MNSLRVISLLLATLVSNSASTMAQDSLNQHPVQLDTEGKLVSWVQPQEEAYDRVVRGAWDFLINRVPVEDNGLKA